MRCKRPAMRMTWKLATIMSKGRTMAMPIDNLPAIHPGSFLRDELTALNLSARKFADHIHVPHNAITGILNGERSITAQMAIRIGRAFGTTPQYWLNLQTIYDLKLARANMPTDALGIKAAYAKIYDSVAADAPRARSVSRNKVRA